MVKISMRNEFSTWSHKGDPEENYEWMMHLEAYWDLDPEDEIPSTPKARPDFSFTVMCPEEITAECWEAFIASGEKKEKSSIGFYQGNGDGSMCTDPETGKLKTCAQPSGGGGDVESVAYLPLEESIAAIKAAVEEAKDKDYFGLTRCE